MKTKILKVIPAAAVAALLLFSCSGGGSQRAKDDSFSLYVGTVSSSLPSTYMPWLSNQGISPTISSSIYSTLFVYDDETGTFEPNLAESWEYVVDPVDVPPEQDYLEVKIILDKDASWSDGEAVTSEDVYFTFDLASDFGRTNHAGALAWTGDLMHRYERDSEGDWQLVRQGIFYRDAPGPYAFAEGEDNVIYFHVRKVLGGVTPLFTTILILPQHLWKIISPKNQLNSSNPIPVVKKLFVNPVGSGPYTLNTEESNSSVITLNKRDDFHLKDENGEDFYKPETIKFINYLDMNVAINALKKGDIDVIHESIDAAYVENLKQTEHLALDFAEGLFLSTLVLNLNPPAEYRSPAREILSIPEVREAIALAIDQEKLIASALKGYGKPASPGLISSSLAIHNPAVKIKEPDIERARNLLDQAGCTLAEGAKYRSKDGVNLSYAISGNQAAKNLINYVSVQLEQIGIETYFEEGGSNAVKDRYYTGNFDMTVQGVILDSRNLDMMMKAHFVTQGSSSNYGRLEDPELTVMIEEMRTTLDQEKKTELIMDIQAAVAELNYKIPLYRADVISVYRTDTYSGWTSVPGTTVYNDETLSNLQFIE